VEALRRDITPAEVVSKFEAEIGDRLVVVRTVKSSVVKSGWTAIEAPPELRDRYGSMTISVWVDIAEHLEDSFWNRTPDAAGIYWTYNEPERGDPTPYWVAVKVYGNVDLAWWMPERALDPQWPVVDRILAALVANEHDATPTARTGGGG
jgi:hypothetical protein